MGRRMLIGVASVGVALSLLSAAPAWARGANLEYATSVNGRVRYVNRVQQFMVLDDGTVFYAERADQLEQLGPGDAVHVQFVSTAGQKRIERIEKLVP